MNTIAVVNQKGGCGKTTVSINLASALAHTGKKTLLVDMDSQGHCAVGLAVPEEQIEQSIYDVLINVTRDEELNLDEILWEISENLSLAPSSIDMAAFEQQMSGIVEREQCLKKVLEKVQDKFDYCVIDCPPAVGLATFNALSAATEVIVPVETGYFSLHGLSKQLETLDLLRQRCNHEINVRVLASMYDIRTKMSREILAELRRHFKDRLFETVITFNTKLKEAASLGQPIDEYDPANKGCKNFRALTEELVGEEKALENKLIVDSLSKQLERLATNANDLLEEAGIEQNADKGKIEEKLSDLYGISHSEGAVRFVTLYPRAQSVQIAGDFNNWQPEETVMQKADENGHWQKKIKLPQGKYRYRLVVDGQWQQDPYNSYTEMNPFGDYNSVLEVH